MQAVIPKPSWIALTLVVPTLVFGCGSAEQDDAFRQRQLADEVAGAGGNAGEAGAAGEAGSESGGSDTGGSSDGGSAGEEAGAGGENADTGGAPSEGGSDTGGSAYYSTGGIGPEPGPAPTVQALGSGLCSHGSPQPGRGGLGAVIVFLAAVLRPIRRR